MKKIHRFYFDVLPDKKEISISDTSFIHQVRDVLKLQKNEHITLYNEQKEMEVEIAFISKELLKGKKINEISHDNKNSLETILYISLPKKELFEFIVQKATEIGVKEIIPVISTRTIKKSINKERAKKIAKEASEQSHQTFIPVIHNEMSFVDALSHAKQNDINFFFDTQHCVSINEIKDIKNKKKRGIFIGPEGGFTDKERNEAKQHNCIFVSLSEAVFKTETASIIGSYIVTHIIK